MVITIDGPTASGKSTAALLLAQKFGFYYLSTGFLYRSLTYLLLTTRGYSEVDLLDVQQADITVCTDPQRFLYSYDPQAGFCITYDGINITPFLKDALIDTYVAMISSQKIVREAMSAQQRFLAAQQSIVMDGRDVGSYVFPQADYKFYLTASLTVRAMRWQADQARRGHKYTLGECEERVQARDVSDQKRALSPLLIPQGAYVIDNSFMTEEETIQKMVSYIVH